MERIEVDQEDNFAMHFKFQPAPRSGKVVAKAENVGKSYGTNLVLNKVDLEIERGDRMAFVGQNGQGKSTLVKALLKEISAEGNPCTWAKCSCRILCSRSSRRIGRQLNGSSNH